MADDLKTQVDELQKRVLHLEDLMNVDDFGRERRVTGKFIVENTALFQLIPDDATTSTDDKYGEIYITGDNITYIDSDGTVRTVTTGIFPAEELTGSGAITSETSYVELNNSGGAIAATIAAPAAGRFLVITQTDTGTSGHTVTLTAGTYDGTNNIATFDAQYETLVLFGVSSTRFVIVENVGSVGLST